MGATDFAEDAVGAEGAPPTPSVKTRKNADDIGGVFGYKGRGDVVGCGLVFHDATNPVSPDAPVLKIAVFMDGRLTVDGTPSTVQGLRCFGASVDTGIGPGVWIVMGCILSAVCCWLLRHQTPPTVIHVGERMPGPRTGADSE